MMKKLYSIFTLLSFASALCAQADVEHRVIGGTFEDVPSAIIPANGGVYAVGSTSSHGDGTVRGYVTYFNDEFDYQWSLMTPYGSVVENVVDGILAQGSNNLVALSKRLGENGSYNTVIHDISIDGDLLGTTEIVDEDNQTPTTLAYWRGSTYAFGSSEGDCWMIDIEDGAAIETADFYKWGHPLLNETVAAVSVRNDTLYVAGTTVIDGVKQASVWCWGADGEALWARVSPDEEAFGDNYSNDISAYEDGLTLMYSYARENEPLGHGVVFFEDDLGTPGGVISTSGPYYVEGTRLIRQEDSFVKLALINYENGSGTDMVLTRLGAYGGYVDSNSLGTDFNERPVDMEIDDEGVVWVLGTTYGYLNGSASFSIYRIANSQIIGFIDSEEIVLGITNDPVLYSSVDIDEASASSLISIYPNPASERVNLSEAGEWQLYSSTGKLCLEGQGAVAELAGMESGLYFVRVEISGEIATIPLQISNLD